MQRMWEKKEEAENIDNTERGDSPVDFKENTFDNSRGNQFSMNN